MALGNFLVIIVLVFYCKYIFSLFKNKNRNEIKSVNDELDRLRRIPVKTMEEQKRFMDLRYPKTPPFKFKWSMVYKSIPSIIIMFIIYFMFKKMFEYFSIEISIPMAFLIIIISSLLMNFILSKFGLERQSALTQMFRK